MNNELKITKKLANGVNFFYNGSNHMCGKEGYSCHLIN